jgi:hypothetical protein
MTNAAGPPTPAGWFRDPGGSDQLRWWDGTAWTAHLAPVPVAQPAPSPTPVVVPQPAPTPTFGQAPAFTPEDSEERGYVPFQNSWNSTRAYDNLGPGDFARPAQWNTAGVWFLATSAFWGSIIAGLVILALSFWLKIPYPTAFGGTLYTNAYVVSEYLVLFIFYFLAAITDRSKLKKMGYLKTASPLWMLIFFFAPLVYLIIRTVRVKTESGRGLAPLIFYLVTFVVLVGLGIGAAIAIPVFLNSRLHASSSLADSVNATSLASGITTGMEKNGGSYQVTCTPFAEPKSSPVDVTCNAVDLNSKETHTLQIEVDPATAGGQPTVKLLSVTPPISQ